MAHSAISVIKWLIIGFVSFESCTCFPDYYFEEMQKACPYTDFCTVPALIENNNTDDSINCCSPCSCESDCWVWDNCCPDVIHEKPVDLQSANCIPIFVNQSLYDNDPDYDQYRVVDFCPRGYSDKRIVDQCEGKFDQPVDFNDVVAVSDAKHRIYKNRYCASCNGVVDIVSWKLTMELCPEDFSMVGSDFVRTILKNCQLISNPPSQKQSYQMACGDSVNEICPGSLSSEMRQGCHDGPYAPFIHMYRDSTFFLYKNALCFLCQTESETTGGEYGICRKDWKPYTRGMRESIRVLIDPMLSKRISAVPEKLNACSDTETFDYIKKKCVAFFCPPFNLASKGVCHSLGTFTGANIRLDTVLIPTERVLLPNDIQIQDEETSRKYMVGYLRQYGLGRCTLDSFAIKVIIEKDTDVLYCMISEIEIQLNDICQLEDIAGMIKKQLSLYNTISFADIRFNEKISFYRVNDTDGLKTIDPNLFKESTLFQWYPNRILSVNPSASGFFICPYIILDKVQYNSIMTEKNEKGDNLTDLSMTTRLANGFYALSNNSIAVCLDTYFNLYKSSGGQSGRANMIWVIIGLTMATYVN